MKPSMQKTSLATIRKLILNKNERHEHNNKMNINIENIDTFENRNKVCTTQWRTIYEVI